MADIHGITKQALAVNMEIAKRDIMNRDEISTVISDFSYFQVVDNNFIVNVCNAVVVMVNTVRKVSVND